MELVVFLVSLFGFLALGIPIAIVLVLCSMVLMYYGGMWDSMFVMIIPQSMLDGANNYPLMAIPFFVFAGELMGGGGISKRLLDVANVFFGRIRGGLAIVTVVVCMFFAAISGSGPATVAAVGGMVVPTMLEKGYDKKFVLALIAAAGSIGVIIPPSIPMVVYSVTVNSSVSSLFLAGFIPGILIGLVLIVYSYVYARKAGYKGDTEPFSIGRALREVWRGKWALLSPVIILGGIYTGICSPTEAACISVVYALLVGVFAYRTIRFKELVSCLIDTAKTATPVMLILCCCTVFGRILNILNVPQTLAEIVTSNIDSKILVLLAINIFLLFTGMVMDTVPAILILAPIFWPIVQSYGVGAVHFGIIMSVNLAIGFVTPPSGTNLFVAQSLTGTPIARIAKNALPFIGMFLIALMLITYIPQISEFLPALLSTK